MGVDREGIEGPSGRAQPQCRERGDRQPDTHRVEFLRASAQHVVDGAVGVRAAVMIEHDDAVGDARGGVEVVLDQHDRAVTRRDEVLEGGVDLFDTLRVEVRRRLVEHEQGGTHRKGARDREALPATAGQSIGVLVTALPQPHAAQGVLAAREDLVHRHPEVLRGERDLVEECPGHELGIGVLKDHSDVRREDGDGGLLRVEAGDLHRAGERCGNRVRNEPVEGEGQRGLARAARPQEEDDLAARDREARRRGSRCLGALMADADIAHREEGRNGVVGMPDDRRSGDGRGHGHPS